MKLSEEFYEELLNDTRNVKDLLSEVQDKFRVR